MDTALTGDALIDYLMSRFKMSREEAVAEIPKRTPLMSEERFVEFVENVPAGFGRSADEQESIPAHPFLGKVGKVIDVEDEAYNTDRPTGYESVWYLVEFDTGQIWLPSQTYLGCDAEGRDQWCCHLKRVERTPNNEPESNRERRNHPEQSPQRSGL